jgi:rod shape determining protein RodA
MRRSTVDLTWPGWAIVGAIAVLTLIGLACIYITDTHYVGGHDGPANALKQTVRVAASMALALLLLRVGYQAIARHAYLIFVLALIALLPLFLADKLNTSFGGLTTPRNGAYRWIALPGFLLQPSEFMKVAYVIALAWYLRYRRNYTRFAGLLAPFIITAIPMALILMEPDLGTALLLVPVLFIMLFVAGARIWHLALIIFVGAASVPFVWQHAHAYQRLRVTSLLLQSDSLRQAVIAEPDKYQSLATRRQAKEWAASIGYQLVHSKNAIGSGGVLGNGWGDGIYVENPILPDRHNDFVFAIIGHQWGFLGCAMVLACYLVMILAGVRIASETTEPYARLLAIGVLTLLASQVIINVSMTVGLLPVTGMTLPFVSYGGSSLVANFLAIALLISVSQSRPYLLTRNPFTFRREHHEHLQRPIPAGGTAVHS